MSYPPCVMEFDHLESGSKCFDVSKKAIWGSKKRILSEIAKCDLVCANCHRIRTCHRSHVTCHRSSGVEQPSRKRPTRVRLSTVALVSGESAFRPITELINLEALLT